MTAENWKFTIAKAVSACTAPTPITALTYTGKAQPLINAGTTADGTMQYSTDGTNYGTTIPTGENAGEYTVWYKVAGDSNHSDTTPESVGVTIAKAKVEIPAADPTQFTYSGEEQTYTLAASGTGAGENYEITYVDGKLTLSVRPITSSTTTKTETTTNPDGTEEIVKNSLPTEDGIRLTMDGSATVKIIDNSKDFIDTHARWAKDAIDFVSARGLVNGMSATIYAPNASTTRAQLWTILARQNDADLSGGATWFENAQNWAKAKGISDGANPNGTINRAQMVTMLWRAMGQPAAASGTSFADVPADSYYAQAVAWAIENGITAGVGNGKFDPDAACTRGQIATFLYHHTARQGAL